MNKDQVKGVLKDAAGAVQRTAGEITGSEKHQLKGTATQIAGKAQKAAGDLKDAARRRRGDAAK